MDKIAFRVVKTTYGDSMGWGVEAAINGRPLHERTGEAPLDAVSALWPGRVLWLGQPPRYGDLEEDGRVAVTLCTCGIFGCGGTSARIELGDVSVVWTELTEANFGEPRDLGPFEFRRERYERDLSAVVESFRSSQHSGDS